MGEVYGLRSSRLARLRHEYPPSVREACFYGRISIVRHFVDTTRPVDDEVLRTIADYFTPVSRKTTYTCSERRCRFSTWFWHTSHQLQNISKSPLSESLKFQI